MSSSHAARRAPLSVLLVALLGGAAWAQPEKPLPPWDRPIMQKEARRVLVEVRELVKSTSKNDGRAAAAALGDQSWLVRHVAAIRLSVVGLDDETYAELRKNAVPGQQPLPAPDPLRRKVEALVAALQPDPNSVEEDPSPNETLRLVCAVVSEELKHARYDDAARRSLIEHNLAFRHAVKDEGAAWLAVQLLAWTDGAQALHDLGAKSPAKAAGKDGAKVYQWYAENRRYLYWQPHERRMRLDTAAREAKTPSEEFRKEHPWGKDEGPNEKKGPAPQ
ncbi:MAG: hypothetical protein AB7N76_16830 [Planctomycetota bacterium]